MVMMLCSNSSDGGDDDNDVDGNDDNLYARFTCTTCRSSEHVKEVEFISHRHVTRYSSF